MSDSDSKTVALMHPDNTSEEPKKLKVVRHESGPMEGYIEAQYNELSDSFVWPGE